MKQIGQTYPHGNPIVELSRVELDAINKLIEVAKGKTLRDFDRDMYTAVAYEEDVAALLNAVAEWIEVAARANELRHLADRIDMAVKMPQQETK